MHRPTLRLAIAALAPLAAMSWVVACGTSYAEAPRLDEPVFVEDPKPTRDSSVRELETGTIVADAAPDVVTVCDPSTPFQTVLAIAGTLNSAADDSFPTLTDDELTIYFQR